MGRGTGTTCGTMRTRGGADDGCDGLFLVMLLVLELHLFFLSVSGRSYELCGQRLSQ